MCRVQIHSVSSALERTNSEHSMHMQHIQSGATNQLSGLDVKTRSITEELKTAIHTSRSAEQLERERLEARVMTHIDRALVQVESQLVSEDLIV